MKKDGMLQAKAFFTRALITVNGLAHPHYSEWYGIFAAKDRRKQAERNKIEKEVRREEHLWDNRDDEAPTRPITCRGTAPYRAAQEDVGGGETHGDRQLEVRRRTRAVRKERRNAERERQALLRQPTPAVAMERLAQHNRSELNRVCRDDLERIELFNIDWDHYDYDLLEEIRFNCIEDGLTDITLAGALLAADVLQILISHTDPVANIDEMWTARSAAARVVETAMRSANEMWVNRQIAFYLADRQAEDDDYGDYDYDPGPVYDDRDWDYLDSVG